MTDKDEQALASTLPKLCVVQRCRHYQLWPELAAGHSDAFSIAGLPAPLWSNASFRVGVRIALNLPRLNSTPVETLGDVFRLMSAEQVGFRIGGQFHIDNQPNEAISNMKWLGPMSGEVDVYLAVDGDDRLSANDAFRTLSPFMPSVLLHLSSLTGDLLVPCAMPVGVKRDASGNTTQSDGSLPIALTPRVQIPHTTIGLALGQTANLLAATNAKERRFRDLAAKRIGTAATELDPSDRYCDYWEACEFITKGGGSNIQIRLHKRLPEITGFHKNVLVKHIIDPLYKIRCDIVHNAVEDIPRIERALPILKDIAIVLRLAVDGGVFVPTGPLADYYRQTIEKTAAPL